MKNLSIFAGLILLFAASCSNIDTNVEENKSNELVSVRVHVDGFSVSQEEFPVTRATQTLVEYEGVKAITVAFYKSDGTEQTKVTQLRGSMPAGGTFGNFNLSLPMGNFTMVVVARGDFEGDVFTLTSPTAAAYTSDHVRETFAATQAVNITSTNAVDISATLNRIVSRVRLVSTDGRTAEATNIRMTFSGGAAGFNPTTGLATTNTGLSNTVGISAAVGSTSSSTGYLFLATDEQTVDITVETLDGSGNTLFSKVVKNVPLKRNRVTVLTGGMYTNSGITGNFQVETDWLTENNVNF